MYQLHAVIISKEIPLERAKEIAQGIIKNPDKTFYRETKDSYRFRAKPKQEFDPKSFRSKVINNDITLIMGNSFE
jgi:hypothetical protein